MKKVIIPVLIIVGVWLFLFYYHVYPIMTGEQTSTPEQGVITSTVITATNLTKAVEQGKIKIISEEKNTKKSKKLNREERYIKSLSDRIDRLEETEYIPVPKKLIIAQSCIETGYGRVVVGNNLFGMTGKGTAGRIRRKDSDWVNGERVRKWKWFRAYNNRNESVLDFVQWYIDKGWFSEDMGFEDILCCLKKSGYTSDPSYIKMIRGIIKRYKLE